MIFDGSNRAWIGPSVVGTGILRGSTEIVQSAGKGVRRSVDGVKVVERRPSSTRPVPPPRASGSARRTVNAGDQESSLAAHCF
jgi:hypothetical protein